ncbi:plasmid pRiA4b ORF-3 family protein [Nocardia panacis]|uniref:Plasmid pRiA4b ORF-3 family protein n=1 Tax=Nocardia panacis TaxID=2340916 RepID=A0A3A4KZB1_9NOCA|nr:plasmid pRiA4b ORF-3 family protein [Nocardia panacis]RJO74857.1 plasmid pRiA4b ORF-3 family protein [Nocardia panacis]
MNDDHRHEKRRHLRAVTPSRRRPRRDTTVTYRVHIDLGDTQPPLWRRLDLSSDLFLDELHEVIQTAFGWTDSHLHQFGSGPSYYDPLTEYYLCPYMTEDDDQPGVPEEQVRLDEVLQQPDDALFYCYDFGDDWQHTITLETVLPRSTDAPPAICLDGQRPGPPEDCGGIEGYELVAAAADPADSRHAAALTEFHDMFGAESDPSTHPPTVFDIDRINRVLAGFVRRSVTDEIAANLPPVLAALVDAAHGMLRRELLILISRARLDAPVPVDTTVAERVLCRYRRLLDHVGDGVKLTAAGYLPPKVVQALYDEMDMRDGWIGKGNREDQTYPVLSLRESAQALGLLRKHRGQLLPTVKARALHDDPVGLWRYIADHAPRLCKEPYQQHGGLLYLLALTGADDDPQGFVRDSLPALGWMIDIRSFDAAVRDATRPVRDLLEHLNLLTWRQGVYPSTQIPNTDAAEFARAILGGLSK